MNSNNLNKDIFYKSDDLVVSSSLFTTSTPTKKGEYDRGSETSHINKKLINIQNNIMDTDFIPNDSYGSTTFKKNTDGIINHYGGRRKGSGDSASVRVPLDATDTISTSAYTSSYTSSFTPSSYSLSSYTPSNYPSSYSTITSSDIDDRSSSSSTTTTDSSSVTNSNDSDSDQHLDHKKTENSKPKKIKQKSEGGKKKDPSNESKNKESNDKKSIKKKHK